MEASGNLFFAFLLNIFFNVIVIVGAIFTNSVAILADCLHDLTDTISIGLAWGLERISRRDSNKSYTYGYARFSILGAFITSTLVIIISIIVIYEAIDRLFHLVTPDAGGMLLVAILGIVFKGLSAYRLHKGITFNEKAILLHLLADIFEWIAILIISVILIFWDVPFLDPLVSIGISIWLIYSLSKTLKGSLEIFLQKSPSNIDVNEFKNSILAIDGVNSIYDFHLWSLDGIESVLTLKLKIDDENKKENILNIANKIAYNNNIVDVTVEFNYD
ncbi:MAG: cation diffusion facilitator family transporter [Methanobrevibacter sp.]|uniref:cation diffusion facilitator family transporter n=1 Tax=Methanobrevibacter sp. TaxID=66852 RepID=UPI0026DF50EE|nr:cation diffusion facilitator family transporter [Methanobrevibacter sp.]MDO5849382.1 cation diffusion facilitator family transporter [Methanobrevibacter sp.]